MKKINWFLLVFLVVFGFSFKRDGNVLEWHQNRRLTWDDFNGKPEKRFAAASTHYDILKTVSKAEERSHSVKIVAVFFRNSSWKKNNWINEQVLSHEQKHFDIVELFARKLRKSIQEAKFKDYDNMVATVKQLYDKNDKEMDVYQDIYDEETDGSMNGDKQRAWEKKIDREIRELKEYDKTMIPIAFN